MPAATRTCGECGATAQDGGFCDECGMPLPTTAPVPDDSRERAQALIVPVSDPAAKAEAPPVLPGRPEPARPSVVLMPETEDVTGGRPCPVCSALNPVDRHFCRRCAALLAAPPRPVRRSWWRRLLDWVARRRQIPYAGQRPRLHRNRGRLLRWAATLAVAGVAAYAADAWGATAIASVEDHFTRPTIVFATTVSATRSDPAHPIANIHDGFNNTFWGTGETGTSAGVQVDATFGQPIDLLDIVITPGAGVTQDAFTSESSPQTIAVTVTSADGSSTTSTVTLPDSPGPDTFGIHGTDITTITFTIESAFLASDSSNAEVAIAEIEYFAKA
jgi:hypothetical protein